MLFGRLPPASLEQAETHLRRAADLEPSNPSHAIELGFILLAAGRDAAAREQLQRGLDLPSREKHHDLEKTLARDALKSLAG